MVYTSSMEAILQFQLKQDNVMDGAKSLAFYYDFCYQTMTILSYNDDQHQKTRVSQSGHESSLQSGEITASGTPCQPMHPGRQAPRQSRMAKSTYHHRFDQSLATESDFVGQSSIHDRRIAGMVVGFGRQRALSVTTMVLPSSNTHRQVRSGRQFSIRGTVLSQFLNVLKGAMNLIAPRITAPAEALQFGGWRRSLLMLLPRLTGQWQTGDSSDVSDAERAKSDVYCIRSYTICLNLELVLRIFQAVLRGQGACQLPACLTEGSISPPGGKSTSASQLRRRRD